MKTGGVVALLFALFGVCASFHVLDDFESGFRAEDFEGDDVDGEVFLETGGATMDRCHSTGDTHVWPWNNNQFGRSPRYDVMGYGEWIVTEGPEHKAGTPKFSVQVFQSGWQQCNTQNKHITVIKDMAVQCGTFIFIAHPPQYTHNCGRFGGDRNSEYRPEFWVYGRGTDGTEFKGEYLKDPRFRTGKTILFDDGSGGTGKLTITENSVGDTTGNFNSYKRERVTITCAGTTTDYNNQMHPGWNMGGFVTLNVNVPRATDRNEPIRVNGPESNIINGYCGGLSAEASAQLNDAGVTCAGRSFLDASCTPFKTTPETSLFAAMEHFTNGAFKSSVEYSAQDILKAAENAEKIDLVRWEAAKEKCKQTLTALSSVAFTTEPTEGKQINLYSNIEDCTEDEYFDLPWDQKQAKEEYCEYIAYAVEQERRDAECAGLALKRKADDFTLNDGVKNLVKNLKSTDEVKSFRTTISDFTAMTNELSESMKNIAYWSEPACNTEIPDSENLASTDCVNWKFEDTRSSKEKSFLAKHTFHMKSVVVSATHVPISDVSIDGFDDPAVFLGPPSRLGQQPVVPRIRIKNNKVQVYLREATCENWKHTEEFVPVIVLDAAKDYGANAQVVKKDVRSGEWTRFEWTRDMGVNVRVFPSVQTSENALCPDCGDNPPGGAVRGFVTPRVRNVGPTSCEVYLAGEGDQPARDTETVALLVVTGNNGVIGNLAYASGKVTSPNNAESVFDTISDGHKYNTLVSVGQQSGSTPAIVRTTNTERNPTQIKAVLQEACKTSHQGSEDLFWLALERTVD